MVYLAASNVLSATLHSSKPLVFLGASQWCKLDLGRYRFSVFWSVFQKSVSVSVSVFQNIAISVSVFGFSARTYNCLSNNTIADTLCPPLSPEWGLGPRICITNCGHKRQRYCYNRQPIGTHTPSLYRTVLSSTRCALHFSQNREWGPKNLHCDLRPNSNS